MLATNMLGSGIQGLNSNCVTLGGLATSLTASRLAQMLPPSQTPHIEAA